MRKILDWARLIFCVALFAWFAMLAQELVTRSTAHQIRKYDHANINHMKYTIFNINLWKKKLGKIVVSEIQSFKIDENNKEVLKKYMESQLDVLIDKVNQQIKESNKETTGGWFKQRLMNMLVDVKAVKAGIPTYADAIVGQLTSDDTQVQLKSMLKTKVSSYMRKTYEPEDTTDNDLIAKRIGAASIEEAKAKLAQEVPVETQALFELTWKFLAVAIVLFGFAAFHVGKKLPRPNFFICWALLIMLLYVGLVCPMIDMDARIPKFAFVLLGHPVEFLDQVVYFQSKSILDVFLIMIQHQKLEMRLVGVLLVLFSVVFPVMKLTFSTIYYYNFRGLQKNWLVKAMVLKSGKWSMADVLAVAILMSYIGFNGMVTTQMEVMSKAFPGATFISTNGTTLQIGLYIFVTYVILSIIFSMMISKVEKQKPTSNVVHI